jgi:hypothetical protein
MLFEWLLRRRSVPVTLEIGRESGAGLRLKAENIKALRDALRKL